MCVIKTKLIFASLGYNIQIGFMVVIYKNQVNFLQCTKIESIFASKLQKPSQFLKKN